MMFDECGVEWAPVLKYIPIVPSGDCDNGPEIVTDMPKGRRLRDESSGMLASIPKS